MATVFMWIFIALLVIIGAYFLFLMPWAKAQYKKEAYALLGQPDPDPDKVRKTIGTLNQFSGWIIKDEEIKALIGRLAAKVG